MRTAIVSPHHTPLVNHPQFKKKQNGTQKKMMGKQWFGTILRTVSSSSSFIVVATQELPPFIMVRYLMIKSSN